MFHPLMIINQLLSFFSIKNSCHNFYIIYTETPLSAASFMQLFKPTLTSFALKIFKSYFFSILNVSTAYIGIFLILKQIVNAISKQDQQISMLCFVKKALTCFRLHLCYFRKFHSNLSFPVDKDIFNTIKQFIFFVTSHFMEMSLQYNFFQQNKT